MKFFQLLKGFAKQEKPALLFFLKLLILSCLLKCIFFYKNYSITDHWALQSAADLFKLVKWSVLYDVFSIVLINFPLLILLMACGKFFKYPFVKKAILLLFTIANTTALLLNTVDIFYFRFHLQRADADLLYVLRNPLQNGTGIVIVISMALLVFCIIIGTSVYKHLDRLSAAANSNVHFYLSNALMLLFCLLFLINGSKKTVPTYPLTAVKPVQLPLVQNSFHTFLYSLYRRNEILIPDKKYMPDEERVKLFSIRKKNNSAATTPKNIILFIMESVPADFFDSSSADKVAMPFLDSLVQKSTYFSNAFSYSYSSNKGITALLAGVPTMTDIPLYHSGFVSINHTAIGDELAKKNYNSSFFIGDNYDDFGFAQCCRWLGIQHYYSMENIPGYRQMEKHTMGLHDEYVLNFMAQQLAKVKEPFFSVQYNISTHFPNDVPASFNNRFPAKNTTAQMKTMQYYNDCLEQFFRSAAQQPWYKNTVFIFCSDHWTPANLKKINIDVVESFRIPLFIYDPSSEIQHVVSAPVSQTDVMNTILYYSGFKDSLLSYGVSLKDTALNMHRTVFTKTNSAIYHAINERYILGFDAMEGKAVYCYDYKNDTGRKDDLLKKPRFNGADTLIHEMKAYLQTASAHYRKKIN